MTPVHPCPLPETALLRAYLREGAYADCYSTVIPATVSHEQYVEAFYTTWVFKLERHILKWAVAKPSTDDQARQLATGVIDEFAAWRVEQRGPRQLLLSDYRGSTRSWLMVAPLQPGDGTGTRLYFGSAVVAKGKTADGLPEFGLVFHALLGFHQLYSRILLGAARARLLRTTT